MSRAAIFYSELLCEPHHSAADSTCKSAQYSLGADDVHEIRKLVDVLSTDESAFFRKALPLYLSANKYLMDIEAAL